MGILIEKEGEGGGRMNILRFQENGRKDAEGEKKEKSYDI